MPARGKRTSSRKAGSQHGVLRRGDFATLKPIYIEIDGAEVEFPDYPAIARAYAEAVSDGRIPACRLLIAGCRRYLRMLEMAELARNVFYFSPDHAVDYCAFVEKLNHFEGGLWEITQQRPDGTLDSSIILEPWQIWIECAIHGFRRAVTGERLVTTALVVVPRKNGKSLLAAAAALFDLCCSGQLGSEIVVAAASGKQLDQTIWGDLLKMIGKEPDLVEQYKIRTTRDEISTQGSNPGLIIKLSSQGERQDGLNPSLAIFEEGHAGAASVFRVVQSSFGARPNALIRMITTAGYRPEGPGWEMQQEAVRILEGKDEDHTFFAAIYTLDREDYTDQETQAVDFKKLFSLPALIAKANPMYGISLDPIKMAADMKKASRRPDMRGEAARTRFNIWTGSGMSLIEPAAWAACRREISMDDFVGQKCWIGVDLAQVRDMCSIALIFELPGDGLAVFAKFYLPELSPTATDPDVSDIFMAWVDEGHLILTPGPLADHDRVRDDVDLFCDVFDVQQIACDPHQAHNVVKFLWDRDRPVMAYPNSQKTMTAPVDDIIGKVAAGTLAHDGNPVLAWNAANVHGERKGNGLILPRKESENSKRKIDGFVAMCFADGVRINLAAASLAMEQEKVSAYEPGRRVVGLENA